MQADIQCGYLSNISYDATWPVTVTVLCRVTSGCVAVRIFYANTRYQYCLTGLSATSVNMTYEGQKGTACLGTYVASELMQAGIPDLENFNMNLPSQSPLSIPPLNPLCYLYSLPTHHPAPTSCMMSAPVAPAGWTFKQQQDTSTYYSFNSLVDVGNWPSEQIDKCASTPNCVATSVSLLSYDTKIFLFSSYRTSENLQSIGDASESSMPEMCMGTMVKNGESLGDCGC